MKGNVKMGKKYDEKIKNRYNGKYTLGLDIGTNSVGWAAINEASQVISYKDKKAWGVRLFDAGLTAENRRLKRGMRRRINRRKKRIEYLQELFQKEIDEKYPNFLFAINELETPRGIEQEEHYKKKITANSLPKILKMVARTQIEYRELILKYPTIFHLRYDIIMHPERQFDLRLIYLALHNIVKKRGHFLNEGLKIEQLDKIDYDNMMRVINEILFDEQEENAEVSIENCISIEEILKESETRNDRAKKVKKVNKKLDFIGKALVGLKFDVEKLFNIDDEKTSISFEQEDFIETAEKVLNDDQLELLMQLQRIYISIQFSEIIGDESCLSGAKIAAFNDFSTDMNDLKQVLEGTEAYYNMFVSSKESLRKWEENREDSRCVYDKYRTNSIKYDEYIGQVKKMIENLSLIEEKQEKLEQINVRIAQEKFMKKLNTTSNSAIPHQLNLYEAQKIMEGQSKYYPQLFSNEVQGKIGKIISFRIPYYVGPLVKEENSSEFGWMKRKTDEAIRPWNFETVVDKAASGEAFIQRMVGGCSYLLKEKAMPKLSLTYQLFEVLNELNVTKLDDKRINKEVRDTLLSLFLKNKSVSNRNAQTALKSAGINGIISGNQKESGFATSLTTWQTMSEIFGNITVESVFGKNKNEQACLQFEMIETIIMWLTVFTEKSILVERIKSAYPQITEAQIEKIRKLNYKGWGRLSETLLVSVIPDVKKHHGMNIIEMQLYFEDGNRMLGFQEIITDSSLGFKESIEKKNATLMQDKNEISYDLIAELAGSPGIKRGIWQALQIIEECESIFGFPTAIVLETAKEEGAKRRTKSRESQWGEILKTLKGSTFFEEFKELKGKADNYMNDRVWLYLNQEGRCMYTGDKLDIERLETYEIDHIMPYSLTGDNSIDNRVLVKKSANQVKGGYLMPLEIMNGVAEQQRQKMLWARLYDKKMISSKKYTNLLKETVTPKMAEGFANRQLVETRQITKHVIQLLEQKYETNDKKVQVVGLKAQINDRVKRELGIVKIRELNDKHHAVDAFMAAFIHQSIKTYGKDAYIDGKLDWKRYQKNKTQLGTPDNTGRREFSWVAQDIKQNGVCNAQTGEQLVEGDKIYEFLLSVIDQPKFCVTFKTGTQGEDKGFWNETLYSPKLTNKKITLPEVVGKKYLGNYSTLKANKTVVLSYLNKKKERDVRSVDISNYDIVIGERNALNDIINKESDNNSFKLLYTLEKKKLIIRNGFPCLFTSSQAIQKANQLNLSQKQQKIYIRSRNIGEDINSDKKNLDWDEIINGQNDLILFLQNQIENIYALFLNSNQVEMIVSSCQRYIKLNDSVKSLEKDKMREHFFEMNELQVYKKGKSKENSILTKTKIIVEKDIPLEISLNTFSKVTTVFLEMLLRVMKRGASRVEEWNRAGFSNPNVVKCDNLVVVEQSITGLNERKITIISDGKVCK